jgi:drug/metabolite transporter (DMT)-like permease
MGGRVEVKKKALQPYVWMLVGSFAFSWMGIFAHLAGAGCPWQVIAVVRSLLPLTIVAAWAWLDGVPLVFFGPPVLWMRSIAGSCSLVGTFYALTHLPPPDVFTLANMFPIWVALLSWPMLGVLPGRAVWLSVASGAAGVVLIQRPQLQEGDYTALLVVGVSLFTALAMMGLHRLKGLDARAIVVHFSAVSAVFSLAAAFLFETSAPAEPFALRHLALLLGVGATATTGQLFLTRAFTTGEPAKVSVVSLTQIVFVLVLDVLLVGHTFDPAKLLGIPLIIVPTAWLMLRPPRRPPQRVVAPVPAESSCAG